MFIRSENLFVRPAWPEDRAGLVRLEVPVRHDPLRAEDGAQGLVITMPGVGDRRIGGAPKAPTGGGARIIGTAGFRPLRGRWDAQVWLAPAWRHLGLMPEAEATLAALAANLPPLRGMGGLAMERVEVLAA